MKFKYDFEIDDLIEESKGYAQVEYNQATLIRPIITVYRPGMKSFSVQFPYADTPEERFEHLRQASFLSTFSDPFLTVFLSDSTLPLLTPVDGVETTDALLFVHTTKQQVHVRILPYTADPDTLEVTWSPQDIVEQDSEAVFSRPELSSFIAANVFLPWSMLPWSSYRKYLESKYFKFLYHGATTAENLGSLSKHLI